jgi:uncharacterized protein (DUF58 family)
MQLTTRGILLLLAAVPMIGAATWLPQMNWVSGIYLLICLGLLLMDWRFAGRSEYFTLNRNHDSRLSLGADNPVVITLNHRGRRLVKFWIRDEPPVEFGLSHQILPGEVKLHETWVGTYTVHPFQRGDFQFGNLNLRWQGPLGIIIKQGKFEKSSPVKVFPNLLNLRQYDLLLRRNRIQEMGLRHARLFGEGTEYERLREYIPDDDFRRIDWKATARRYRPITIEYQTERSQNIMLVLDIGRMSQSPILKIAKLDYMINTALLLAYVAIGKGDKVGLMTFDKDVNSFAFPRQGRGQFFRILELLYAVKAQQVESDYRHAFSYLASKLQKRSLIVIFTNIGGGIGLTSLRKNISVLRKRSLPLVVTISDPDIHKAATQHPVDSFTTYQRMVAKDLTEERTVVVNTFRQNGILTLDVPANKLTLAVINRYLEIKGKTQI